MYYPGTSLTAKYDSAGSRQWVNTYSDLASAGFTMRVPRWLGVDTSGNVLVAGVTDQGTVILKHDSSGRAQWVERLDSVSLRAITLDNDGNVIAAMSGYSLGYSLRKYDLTGTIAWTRELTGIDCSVLLVDAAGDILLAGTWYCYITVKLDRNGFERWRMTYRELGFSEDGANALAVDAWGNCYVGGSSYATDSWLDGMTVKYDPNGVEQWLARYAGPGLSFESITDVATDASGSVYVTGDSDAGLVTLKYAQNGSILWEKHFSELRYSSARILVDRAGHSYVMGSSWAAPGDPDVVLLSYTTDGQERWVRSYDLVGIAWAEGFAIDPTGNLYIGAMTTDPTDIQNFVLMMVDSLGERKWLATYGPLETHENWLAGLGVDHQGNAFIAGHNEEKSLLVKYNSAGAVQWAAHSPVRARPSAICVDPHGNSYLTGWTYGLYATDAMTMCYDSSGQLLWLHQFGDDVHNENGRFLAIDSAGSAYVVGSVEETSEPVGIIVLKYARDGQIVWQARYHGPGPGEAQPRDVAVSTKGEVFITGYSGGPWPDVASCMLTIKYVQGATSAAARASTAPNMFVLHQNYPNPFNPSTSIKYELPKSTKVILSVYDMLGREVSTLVNERRDAGVYRVKFDASGLSSGVYFYRLQAGEFVQTRKLLLMK